MSSSNSFMEQDASRKTWKDLISRLSAEAVGESGLSDKCRHDLQKTVVDSVNNYLSCSAAVREQLQKKTPGTPHCTSFLHFLNLCVTEFRPYLFIYSVNEPSECSGALKSPVTDLTLWVVVKLIDILADPECQPLHDQITGLLTDIFHSVYTSDGMAYNAMIMELLKVVSDLHQGVQTLVDLPSHHLDSRVFPVYIHLFRELIPNCSALEGCDDLTNCCLIEVICPLSLIHI